jgi:hypothetical protein
LPTILGCRPSPERYEKRYETPLPRFSRTSPHLSPPPISSGSLSHSDARASCIVTWLGVFPIVTIIFSLFGHWLNLLPTLVRTLVLTAVMVTLTTYVVMPRLTRLFSFWLYPEGE